MTSQFWQALEALFSTHTLVIDRPRGTAHPHFPEWIYPLDYGYLQETRAQDGSGIDVWVGSGKRQELTGILCTLDLLKKDAEIKLLLGCSESDIRTITSFLDGDSMRYLYVPRPKENS